MSEATARQPPAARRARPAPPPGIPTRDSTGTDDPRPVEDDAAPTLEAYVAAMVAAAPPLTSEQRDRLAPLLRAQRRRLQHIQTSRTRHCKQQRPGGQVRPSGRCRIRC